MRATAETMPASSILSSAIMLNVREILVVLGINSRVQNILQNCHTVLCNGCNVTKVDNKCQVVSHKSQRKR